MGSMDYEEINHKLDILLGAVAIVAIISFLVFLGGVVYGEKRGCVVAKDALASAYKAQGYHQGYANGYRQGVLDALGSPESVLAELLCRGEYSATVTIDGRSFQLLCQEQG